MHFLGGRGLSGICRALAVNYKKFSSGAPDLLLVRVSRPSVAAENIPRNGPSSDDFSRTQNRSQAGCIPECYDISGILGQNWNILGQSSEEQNEKNERSNTNGYSRKNENDKNQFHDDNHDDAELNNEDIDNDVFQSGLNTNRSSRMVMGNDNDRTTSDFRLNQNTVERKVIKLVEEKDKEKEENEKGKGKENEKGKETGKSRVKGRYNRWRRNSKKDEDDLNNLQETKNEVSSRMKKVENDKNMNMKKRNLFLKVESTQMDLFVEAESTIFKLTDSDDERKGRNLLENEFMDGFDQKLNNADDLINNIHNINDINNDDNDNDDNDINIDNHDNNNTNNTNKKKNININNDDNDDNVDDVNIHNDDNDDDNDDNDINIDNDDNNDNSDNDCNNNVTINNSSTIVDEDQKSTSKNTEKDDVSPTHSIFPCALSDLILPTYNKSKKVIGNNVILSQNNDIEDNCFIYSDSLRIAEDGSRIEIESNKKVEIGTQKGGLKEEEKLTECKDMNHMGNKLIANSSMETKMKVDEDAYQAGDIRCCNDDNDIDDSNYRNNNNSKSNNENNANNNNNNHDNNDIDNMNNINCHNGWRYECMLVEVKGPTDHLADHQLMWLRVLHRYGVTAIVGHVKETEGSK